MRSLTSHSFSPDDPVSTLPLIGPHYAERLQKLGIESVRDLIFHFPFRYQDTRDIISIAELEKKEGGTIRAIVASISNARTRTRKWITRATLQDGSDRITAVWFNQPYLTKTIRTNQTYLFSGKLNAKWGSPSLTSPEYELDPLGGDLFEMPANRETTHLGKLTPIYPETYGISSKWLRARIKWLKPYISSIVGEYIPETILKEENLMPLRKAVLAMHFGKDEDEIQQAQYRLGIDELITIRRQAQAFLSNRKKQVALDFPLQKSGYYDTLIRSLPYQLTPSQEEALAEITGDLARSIPMYRLLNGDVGSGKTILALLASLCVCDGGCTSVIMAPTTILAQQHYKTIKSLLSKSLPNLNVALVTGAEDVPPKDAPIIIGTHALLFRDVLPSNVGLVIIDEQHRFGVVQRKKLASLSKNASGTFPHYLTMTATPIPRTLTMAMYGTQNVSLLRELPPGRIPVKTYVVPNRKRKEAYHWIDTMLEKGERAFFIYPLVEESEKLEAKSAIEEQARLQNDVFPHRHVGLVHGQMKEADKKKSLEDFRSGKTEILVATSVVEVGIDIPEASIMIIENAERYGLAQLHQLRGRVGRGKTQSYCFLFAQAASDDARGRLDYFSTHSSGFEVAEYDLKRRGPGEVYGTRQSGLLDIRFADISDPKQFKVAERISEKLR